METSDIADSWRQAVASEEPWFVCDNQAGLDPDTAEGMYMHCQSADWRRAYVKPKFPGGLPGRAAREKIASDLAHDLLVPVPPVILVDRNDAGLAQHKHVAASLVMFKTQHSWGLVQTFLEQESSRLRKQAVLTVGYDSARALAFDTWVGQTEHHDRHPSNIILGWDTEGEPRYQFLDYEFAFGLPDDSWRGARAMQVVAAPFPEELLARLDVGELELAVADIENMDAGLIADVVERIPEQFLELGVGRQIRDGLIARRTLVRAALAGTL